MTLWALTVVGLWASSSLSSYLSSFFSHLKWRWLDNPNGHLSLACCGGELSGRKASGSGTAVMIRVIINTVLSLLLNTALSVFQALPQGFKSNPF